MRQLQRWLAPGALLALAGGGALVGLAGLMAVQPARQQQRVAEGQAYRLWETAMHHQQLQPLRRQLEAEGKGCCDSVALGRAGLAPVNEATLEAVRLVQYRSRQRIRRLRPPDPRQLRRPSTGGRNLCGCPRRPHGNCQAAGGCRSGRQHALCGAGGNRWCHRVGSWR